MRIVVLLASTLLGAAAGFLAGAYLFNYTHPFPARSTPLSSLPYGTARQLQELQVIERQGGGAIQHHMARHSWMHGGCVAGAILGFAGPLLATRLWRLSGRQEATLEP